MDEFHMSDVHPTVVIADDNHGIRRVVAELLHPSFTILAQAADGEAAFKAISELRPAMAILDLSMPKINGFEVARRLCRAQCPTKVVFLTLQEGRELVTEARLLGHGYVAKMRLCSDLFRALSAALQDQFFASDSV
jgi:DNA-binding NarL/FixJ family response regulator